MYIKNSYREIIFISPSLKSYDMYNLCRYNK